METPWVRVCACAAAACLVASGLLAGGAGASWPLRIPCLVTTPATSTPMIRSATGAKDRSRGKKAALRRQDSPVPIPSITRKPAAATRKDGDSGNTATTATRDTVTASTATSRPRRQRPLRQRPRRQRPRRQPTPRRPRRQRPEHGQRDDHGRRPATATTSSETASDDEVHGPTTTTSDDNRRPSENDCRPVGRDGPLPVGQPPGPGGGGGGGGGHPEVPSGHPRIPPRMQLRRS